MKKVILVVIAALFTVASVVPAQAHAGFDFRGVTPTKGKSSVVLLRIGHGCTAPDGVSKVGTYSVSVVVPATVLVAPASAAMQIPGFDAVVTPSSQKDESGTAVSNTITWTAKDDAFIVNPVGFAEFGIRGSWASAGSFFMETTQVCRLVTTTTVPGYVKSITDPKTKAKVKVWMPERIKKSYTEYMLKWNIQDSKAASTFNADKTVETGPAPVLVISA